MKLTTNERVFFNEDTHLYATEDFEELHGITGILHEQIFPDMYSDVSETVLRKAAERGSSIHKMLEVFDNEQREELPDTESADIILANYKTILTDNALTHEASEYLVSDNRYWASCIDKVYRASEDEFILADIKTTYKLNEDYVSWQLSIYAYLFELQNPGAKATKLYAIWLRGDKYKFVEVQRKDTEVVKVLLLASEQGEKFINPYAREELAMPDELAELESALADIIVRADAINKEKDALASKVKQWITDHETESGRSVAKLKGSLITVSKTQSTTKVKFDEKRFASEQADIYSQYQLQTSTPSAVRITINKDNGHKD